MSLQLLTGISDPKDSKEKIGAALTPSNLSARSTPNASVRGGSPNSKTQKLPGPGSVENAKKPARNGNVNTRDLRIGQNSSIEEGRAAVPIEEASSRPEDALDDSHSCSPLDAIATRLSPKAETQFATREPANFTGQTDCPDAPQTGHAVPALTTGTAAALFPSPPVSPRSDTLPMFMQAGAASETDTDGHFQVEPGKPIDLSPEYPQGRSVPPAETSLRALPLRPISARVGHRVLTWQSAESVGGGALTPRSCPQVQNQEAPRLRLAATKPCLRLLSAFEQTRHSTSSAAPVVIGYICPTG